MIPRHPNSAFDPHAHRPVLGPLIAAIADADVLDSRALNRVVKRHPKEGRGLFSKSEIIAGYRAFGRFETELSEDEFLARVRLRPVRTLSGVTPVTVLTKPFPCPGTCIFCPSDVRMPKSYLADEPGAQRAEDNRFDPYLQTWNRLAAYREIGHPTEKVELIVLGGTWSFYPEPYQIWFTLRCFEAMNDFGSQVDGRATAGAAPARYRNLATLESGGTSTYNKAVGGFLKTELAGEWLHESEEATWGSLLSAQKTNEDVGSRCVGLVFETRPDHVTTEEVLRLRRLGATKVQLGIQSLSDARLLANKRGHDVAATREAIRRLRGAGFKVHAHWMPNLLGATAESDLEDFSQLFGDPDFRPDELKLYPCLLVETAELSQHHARGEWQAYNDDVLADLLASCIEQTPRYCRLTRVIRDFSAHDVVAGTHKANLREVAESRVRGREGLLADIRSREIRAEVFDPKSLELLETTYETSIGEERFLEFVTPEDRIVGYLRLALPASTSEVEELGGSALVRELHVYGASLRLGTREGGVAQHAGLGQRLLAAAVERARASGYSSLAVISAIGTRGYYRAQGFRDGVLYQHRELLP